MIDRLDEQVVSRAARVALGQVLDALGTMAEGRWGGYLRIFTSTKERAKEGPKGWIQLYEWKVSIAEVSGPTDRYEIISMEKAIRLMKFWALSGQFSSWQSRRPELWEYGGAIILETPDSLVLLSFSGLPEEGDEALDLLLGRQMRWGGYGQETQILEVSRNELAARLLTAA